MYRNNGSETSGTQLRRFPTEFFPQRPKDFTPESPFEPWVIPKIPVVLPRRRTPRHSPGEEERGRVNKLSPSPPSLLVLYWYHLRQPTRCLSRRVYLTNIYWNRTDILFLFPPCQMVHYFSY